MDTAINERLKEARHALKLTQKQFAQGIFIKSSGYIGDIEIYKHEVNERIIELVSSIYGVNKVWLKTGNGRMFGEERVDTQMEQMNVLFGQLNPDFKKYVVAQIKNLIKLQDTHATP